MSPTHSYTKDFDIFLPYSLVSLFGDTFLGHFSSHRKGLERESRNFPDSHISVERSPKFFQVSHSSLFTYREDSENFFESHTSPFPSQENETLEGPKVARLKLGQVRSLITL